MILFDKYCNIATLKEGRRKHFCSGRDKVKEDKVSIAKLRTR
jgi:hypothetical protein